MGVVEVRVHGVSGTSPDQMLDDPHPRLITGDRLSGFYRPRAGREPDDRTEQEAYAWGGLTSGSPWRALWVLLLPFALINTAASMHRTRAHVARPLTRLLALSLTATLVLSIYVLSADLVAWQCGSEVACIERHSYTRWLGGRGSTHLGGGSWSRCCSRSASSVCCGRWAAQHGNARRRTCRRRRSCRA